MSEPRGLPRWFGLERYGVGPDDVVRQTLGCEPERIRPLVVLAPVWAPQVLADEVDRGEVVSDGLTKVDDIVSGALSFSYVRSGIGAPQAGDVTLALGCTPCSHILFIGSVGGLSESQHVGDLVVPTGSISGDGYSGYLAESSSGPAPPADRRAAPDAGFQAVVEGCARQACEPAGVTLHAGPVYCTDTIVAQFHHLDWMVARFGCIGIEMETSAVFRASRLVGIRAAALLQLSDVIPARKSLFSGRTASDQARRRGVRATVLARAVVAALRAVAGAVPANP